MFRRIMPNIPIINAKKLIKIVTKIGFELNRIRGSHHIFVHKEKKLTISTLCTQAMILVVGLHFLYSKMPKFP